MRSAVMLILLTLGIYCFADYRPDRDGAETSILLHVVDGEGVSIADASVEFVMYTTLERFDVLKRTTDSQGTCVVSGKTRGEVVAIVKKSGYYPTRTHIEYRDLPWEDSVSERRWTRTRVANKVQLKRIVRPVRLKSSSMRFGKPPEVNRPLPFDAMVFDWCAPHGKGQVNDFEITCYDVTNNASRRSYGLLINTTNCVDGFVFRKTDDWSLFRHDLVANTNACFLKEVKIGSIPGNAGKFAECPRLSKEDYVLFRIRTSTNEVGKVETAYYGMIDEGLNFYGELSMSILVNPKKNDPNLEDDWVSRHMKKAYE